MSLWSMWWWIARKIGIWFQKITKKEKNGKSANLAPRHFEMLWSQKNERKIELCRSHCDRKEDLIAEFKRKWRHLKSKRSKRSLTRLVVDSVSKSDGNSHGFFVKNMDRMPSLKTKSKTPVQRVTSLLRAFFSNQTES